MSTITTRSGKGSPLTHNEVDANFTNLNTDKYQSGDDVTFGSFTSTGIDDNAVSTAITIDSSQDVTFTSDAKFPDNGKAIFGAGSDLQIYHDGVTNDSVIVESGAGNLVVQGDSLRLTNTSGVRYLQGNSGAEVNLWHAGSKKLETTSTGIDVTGQVVSSDSFKLTTNVSTPNGNTMFRPDSNTLAFGTNSIERMRITSSGNVGIGVSNLVTGSSRRVLQVSTGSDGGQIAFADSTTEAANPRIFATNKSDLKLASANSGASTIQFITGTTTPAERMRIDSSGNVGIGTNSIASEARLAVDGGRLYIDADDAFGLRLLNSGTSGAFIGTSAADTLNFYNGTGTERMRIASSGYVGIGTTNPASLLHLYSSTPILKMEHAAGSSSRIYFRDATDGDWGAINASYGASGATKAIGISPGSGTGDTRFGGLTISATTATFGGVFQDTDVIVNGNVGIGTASPTTKLHVNGGTTNTLALFESTDAGASISFKDGNTTINPEVDCRTNDLVFNTNNTERMRIDSSGNVGIGTDTVSFASGYTTVNINGSTGGQIHFSDDDVKVADFTAQTGDLFIQSAGVTSFRTGGFGSGDEAMRIDSSGRVFIGKTSDNDNTAGHTLHSSGLVVHTRDSSFAAIFNRTTNDGDIAQFKKDGATVGSIGSNGGTNLYLTSGGRGLRFNDNDFSPITSANAYSDNTTDLGRTAARFDDIYATNGTIQTSDANEKQDIEALSEAETRVAVAAKGLLRKFRWKSAVEEKGDEARIHFGIIAQDLQAAFEAEGLDAGDYAMFIHSTWTDEETGEERSRMGVRYSELLAFIIAAI